jgi:DnaJ-class molecular chaperone
MPACRQEWALAVDPYTTLGVKKHATQAEIQKAYRRLAKKLHPDLNPGNKIAEDKFKEVSAAYDLLGDPEKRARFDRGEIDGSGTERPRQQYYRDFADQNGWSAYTNNSGFSDFGDFAGSEDILSEIFGRAGSESIIGVGALVGIDAGQPSDHRLVDVAAAGSSRYTSPERNWAAGVLLRGCALTCFPSPARLLPAKRGFCPLGCWRYVLCTSS